MRIEGAVALVTGANRGLGAAFARALVERGAKTSTRASATRPRCGIPPSSPLPLDVTDPGQVAAAAERCGDVDLVINNAGVLGQAEREMATN
ncbi:SDR family NAD(P)-dependent oxidoreductase [Nonomuraea dietziae]|uniref:NAD(P)-dependent dehydrogenase (Short-subunit alcohol dehydrogenase family) n=1 Tax=Nonomuraea dietziae TaxID=65515 RepID=A0A7W5Y6G4_9ACTN|nr:SDR family NAD(P)-dependent oxidoreductase [Nonomuraea dietziae]MBB3726138.1 NAD(P)-dependent dehydrogenase (short-subunit alcohol dehydrogenase family) [Nonomuraea dietziae]